MYQEKFSREVRAMPEGSGLSTMYSTVSDSASVTRMIHEGNINEEEI